MNSLALSCYENGFLLLKVNLIILNKNYSLILIEVISRVSIFL